VVDYATAKWLLLGAVPSVVAGAVLAHRIPTQLLTVALGIGLLGLGGFFVGFDPTDTDDSDRENPPRRDGGDVTVIEAADGETYTYDTCWRPAGIGLATIGGFITAGLPEITTTQLIVRCRLPPRVAIATSVFVLAIAATAGALVHAFVATPVWYVVVWSIPGALVGSTVGTRVGKHIPSDQLERGLGVVFFLLGLIVLWNELLV